MVHWIICLTLVAAAFRRTLGFTHTFFWKLCDKLKIPFLWRENRSPLTLGINDLFASGFSRIQCQTIDDIKVVPSIEFLSQSLMAVPPCASLHRDKTGSSYCPSHVPYRRVTSEAYKSSRYSSQIPQLRSSLPGRKDSDAWALPVDLCAQRHTIIHVYRQQIPPGLRGS